MNSADNQNFSRKPDSSGKQVPEHTEQLKRITIGILAHVDAGKTTLSEALLLNAGAIRKAGRVDHGDAFLDTDEQEKQRGITIYSKQAVFRHGGTLFTLLDTPGHVDFSSETERALQVLDAAVLVVSAPDGVQSHTLTLWNLLKAYHIPVFLFLNKMDQPGTDRAAALADLRSRLNGAFLDFNSDLTSSGSQEELAVLDEPLLDRYLEKNIPVSEADIRRLIRERKLFPCWFGSALKNQGVDALLDGLDRFSSAADYPAEFGARVFKITRDQGTRLTWMKITGGTLLPKTVLKETGEKADQLRLYSGSRFQTLSEAPSGTVLAVTGLEKTRAGEGLGIEKNGRFPLLSPVLSCRVLLPEGTDAAEMYPEFRRIEEEDPELKVLWNEQAGEIQVQLMGTVQKEVLRALVKKRCGVEIGFDRGTIAYRETIRDTVEGVGHFEPLRHYAEVHLLLEPGEPGSGVVYSSNVRTDSLASNWQHLVLSSLAEKVHLGVLTGSPITDVRITLAAGRASEKHTEGGDFREASWRAVRNGLMQAQSVLLEPWYTFSLTVPQENIGRALTDLDRMSAQFGVSGTCITGRAPFSEIMNYADTVRAYTRGSGSLTLAYAGYFPCHNEEEVIAERNYIPELDPGNSADSVFCSHGVGTLVPWYEVKEHMHLPSVLETEDGEQEKAAEEAAAAARRRADAGEPERFLSVEEIDEIINRTFFANRRSETHKRRPFAKRRRFKETIAAAGAGNAGTSGRAEGTLPKKAAARKEYLLCDGYNIIFSWEELNALAAVNIDSARLALMDILSNYQGYRGCELILVFDAYRIAGHREENLDWYNIHVVYTKDAQTADSYIERFSHDHAKTDRVIVATSDGLEQIIVRSAGSELMSSRDLREDVLKRAGTPDTIHLDNPAAPKNRPLGEALKQLKQNEQQNEKQNEKN